MFHFHLLGLVMIFVVDVCFQVPETGRRSFSIRVAYSGESAIHVGLGGNHRSSCAVAIISAAFWRSASASCDGPNLIVSLSSLPVKRKGGW